MTEGKKNLVLIGMPGCGKTTLGSLLARRLGRPFWDIDTLTREKCGCPIPEFFREQGEPAFRELEAQSVRELSSVRGAVIATGGGTVLRDENVRLLREGGFLILLLRSLELLSREGRPLSMKNGPEQLWQQRRKRYLQCADALAENNGTFDECLDTLALIASKEAGI